MKHYKSEEFLQFLECQAPLHKRKAPSIEYFLATVLYQCEVGFPGLLKSNRNIETEWMCDQFSLSKIKSSITKPAGKCCQEHKSR